VSDWRPPAATIDAMRHYLELNFLGADIVTWTDADTTSQFFNLRAEAGPLFCLAVPRAVFERLTAEEMVELMETAEIAEQMRAESPRRVTLEVEERK
jgi:hypothetical protein